MKSRIKCILLLFITVSVLCNCSVEQYVTKTEDGFYTYDDKMYKNDGEIFLSEKEWEYVELIEEFPKGMQGAAYYTCAFRYGKWLLLGVEESRCLQGMDVVISC